MAGLVFQRCLQLQGAARFVSSFDRPNIRYTIVEKNNPTDQLLRFVAEHRGEAGIVYCQSRRRVEQLAERLEAVLDASSEGALFDATVEALEGVIGLLSRLSPRIAATR